MADFSIPIIVNEKINPLFIKSNGLLISENYKELMECKDDESRNEKLVTLWKEIYQAELIYNTEMQHWCEIKFNNHHNLTMFLLKNS